MTIFSTKALLGTAVSFALLSTANVASAADLDNLSDDDLLARIERLEKIIGPGDKFAVRSGTDKVRVTVNGQVNRLALGFSDGENSGFANLDNITSNTRFRILGSARLNDKVTAGTRIEASVVGDASTGYTQLARNNSGATITNAFGLRYANFFVKHDDYGKVTVGQGDTASNGSFHNDLTGTFVAGYSETHLIGGGLRFRSNNAGVQGLSTISIADATSGAGFDGGSRDDVLRYDTPAFFGGLSLAASITNDEEYAVAASYKNKNLAGFAVAATVAFTDFGTLRSGTPSSAGGDRELLSGSVSVLHKASGVSLTYSGAGDDSQQRAHYGKLGLQGNYIGYGKTHFVVEGGTFTNVVGGEASGTNDNAFGGGAAIASLSGRFTGRVLGGSIVQKIDNLSMEAFIAYRNYSVNSIRGVTFEDINYITSGARIKF